MSKAQRVTGAAIAGLALGLIGVAVAAVPASAEKHRVTTGITGITPTGGATAVLTPNGVRVTTSTDAAEVTWLHTITSPVKLDDVTALKYKTTKLDEDVPGVNDAALAAYILQLKYKVAGHDQTATLVYEPYYNLPTGSGNPVRHVATVWDVKAGKFWSNELGIAAHGGSYAGNKTWAEIVAIVKVLDHDATVSAFGWRQGDTNAGTISLVNDVQFNDDKHTWDVAEVVPTTAPTTTPSASASTPVAAQPSLPVTGNNVPVIVGTAFLLTVVGGGLLYSVRRRKATN